jgi:sensor histidine kinase YesM
MLRIIALGLLLITSTLLRAGTACQIDSLMPAIEEMENDSLKVRRILEAAHTCRYERTDQAIQYCNMALEVSGQIAFDGLNAKIYTTLGLCYYYKQDYAMALSYFFKALQFAEKYHDVHAIASSYINIGNQHNWQGNFALSKGYYLKAINYSQQTSDYDMQITLWNNLGMLEGQLGNYDEAVVYIKNAVDLARQKGMEKASANSLNNLGIAYTFKKDYKEALKYLQEGLRIHLKYENSRGIANSYSDIANAYMEQKNYKEALRYFKKALPESQKTGYVKLTSIVYEKMSELYFATGDYKQAFQYYKLFKQINDSLFSQEKTMQLNELNIQYETGRKDQEITSLKTENSLKETISKRQSLIIVIFVVAVCIFIVLSALLSKNIKSKKTANARLNEQYKLITAQKSEIEKQKKELENYTEHLEKENILAQYETLKNQVNPHFLFNSLNALGSLIKKDQAEAYRFTKEFAKIYRVVLELKEHSLIRLSEELDFIRSYVFLQKIRFSDNMSIDINIPSQYLDYYLPPFSLQLVVENAIKHNIISSEHPLHIEIFYENNRLVVRNNLQIRNNLHGSTGVGSKNMELRYKLISGEEPEFYTDAEYYYARLPLIAEE